MLHWLTFHIAGMKLLKKKDDDLESMFTVSKKKGAAKKQEPAAAAKASGDAKKKLNHTLDSLKTFMVLGIDVPQTTAEIPATIAKVG